MSDTEHLRRILKLSVMYILKWTCWLKETSVNCEAWDNCRSLRSTLKKFRTVTVDAAEVGVYATLSSRGMITNPVICQAG